MFVGAVMVFAKPEKSIRDLDLNSILPAPIMEGVSIPAPEYADLNNDGKEEALVVYCYGASCGGINYFVLGVNEQKPGILYEGSAGHDVPTIVENTIVYETFDPDIPINKGKSVAEMFYDKKHIIYFNGTKFNEKTVNLTKND